MESPTAITRKPPWLETLPTSGLTDAYLRKETARKDAPAERSVPDGDTRSGLTAIIRARSVSLVYAEYQPPVHAAGCPRSQDKEKACTCGAKPWKRKHTLGTWQDGQGSLEAAREAIERISPKATRGKPKAAPPPGALRSMSKVGELLDLFIAGPLSKRAHPARAKSQLERFVRPALADRPLALVTTPEVSAIIERVAAGTKRGEGGPKAARKVRDLLHQMFMLACAKGLLVTNPVDALTAQMLDALGAEKAGKVERYLRLEEVAAFWRTMTNAKLRPSWAGPVARVLVLTGARPGELTRARWSDVDTERRLWNIPRELRTKGGKPQAHTYPLSAPALAAFAELRALAALAHEGARVSEYVVATPGYAGRGRGARDGVKPHVESSALADAFTDWQREGYLALPGGPLTPRDLRRTASFLAMRSTAKATMLERRHLVLGHAQPGVEQHYESEQDIERHRDIAEAVATLVLRLVSEAQAKVVRLHRS